MKNFHTENLAEIWHRAVNLYESGHQNADEFPIENDLSFLQSLGMNKMDVFDFAEDWVCEGEPDLASFLLIHEHRRDYFWEVQNRIESTRKLDPTSLPAKDSEIEGIRWLPRIIPKAKAKLRGELPPETMFCCGGDRNFFHQNRIHPSEFLGAVRRAGDDDQKIIDWVVQKVKDN
jgi:hypothetical protein